jgi:hypothetical protein
MSGDQVRNFLSSNLAGGNCFVIISHKQTIVCLHAFLCNLLPLTNLHHRKQRRKRLNDGPYDDDQRLPPTKEARDAYASRVYGVCFLFFLLFLALLMLSTTRLQLWYVRNRDDNNNNGHQCVATSSPSATATAAAAAAVAPRAWDEPEFSPNDDDRGVAAAAAMAGARRPASRAF